MLDIPKLLAENLATIGLTYFISLCPAHIPKLLLRKHILHKIK